jgi:hypothetical protein
MPQEQYESSVRNLMSTTCLRNMAPDWVNSAVQHISQSLPGEERNIIKKGWDQLYLEPIRKEGFLETVRVSEEVTMQEWQKQQEKLKFKEQTAWMAEHGNIDDFVASWERQEHVPLMPLTPVGAAGTRPVDAPDTRGVGRHGL